jgi:hypothetical protein
MEELQTLVNIVEKLPSTALWVLAGIFAYKTIIIGSIFGLIKLTINKTHDFLTREKVIKYQFKNIYLYDSGEQLEKLLKDVVADGKYLHLRNVYELEKAWEEYKEKKKWKLKLKP